MGGITASGDPVILAGQITGAHGVSGNVRVRLIGANSEVSASALKNTKSITVTRDDPPFQSTLTLSSLRKQAQAKGAWIASFKEVSDRNAAEALYGCSLFVPETSLPELPAGEYYVDQLIGLDMVTDSDRPLGTLVDVMHTPANDVYVTSSGVMVPAVAAFIKSIDLAANRIVVADVPGLLDT
jgi:16S rRNA processing protein RimM